MNGFDFGLNWKAYSEKKLDLQRLDKARQSLQDLLNRKQLDTHSFIDIGCGSGLFSIAAYQMGAGRVVGIDINPVCVEVSLKNRDRFVPDSPITFLMGSVLNPNQLSSLGAFDIVYAWGVLHHTGDMWTAIRNVSDLVMPEGSYVLAIYNKHWTSRIWEPIKWFYNQLPAFLQPLMAIPFSGLIFIAKLLVTGKNPLKKERGMDFWYDVIDWLGGYPYEYASKDEVIKFVISLGFKLCNLIPAQVPTGCNEFIFERIK